jgi:hypothetical protein
VQTPQAQAEVMAAFWAAEPPTRRALAHALAGLTEGCINRDMEVNPEMVLRIVRGLQGTAPPCAKDR